MELSPSLHCKKGGNAGAKCSLQLQKHKTWGKLALLRFFHVHQVGRLTATHLQVSCLYRPLMKSKLAASKWY
jgi:hypothetical protein